MSNGVPIDPCFVVFLQICYHLILIWIKSTRYNSTVLQNKLQALWSYLGISLRISFLSNLENFDRGDRRRSCIDCRYFKGMLFQASYLPFRNWHFVWIWHFEVLETGPVSLREAWIRKNDKLVCSKIITILTIWALSYHVSIQCILKIKHLSSLILDFHTDFLTWSSLHSNHVPWLIDFWIFILFNGEYPPAKSK